MIRESLVLASVICLAAGVAEADPLKIVHVIAQAFNTVFDASGSIVVQDSVSAFAVSGATGRRACRRGPRSTSIARRRPGSTCTRIVCAWKTSGPSTSSRASSR